MRPSFFSGIDFAEMMFLFSSEERSLSVGVCHLERLFQKSVHWIRKKDKKFYEQEAREKWGDAAVDEGNENVLPQQEAINEQFRRLAALRMHAPHSNEVQEAIHAWYELLQTIGTYSYEAFQGLGELYVADERFTENIDQFGEGLASFLCEAMTYYVEQKKAL